MRPSPTGLKNRVEKLDVIRRMSLGTFGGGVYLVGGALRELALGRVPKDYDFVLERREDLGVLQGLFGSSSFLLGKKPIQTHRIVSGEVSIDVTFLETGIVKDLLRRDFTMNAMAYDLKAGTISDPLGGWVDLERKVIRFPREQALKEDPLRMVKAIRHLSSLKGFSLDPELHAAIGANRSLIHLTAAERIKYELDLIMLSHGVFTGISAMEETGLLFEIFPELVPLGEMDQEKGLEPEALGHTLGGFRYVNRIKRFHPFDERETRLSGYALLFHDLGKPQTFSYDEQKGRVHFFHHERFSRDIAAGIMERLKFSSAEARVTLSLIESHMRLFLISRREATEKATRRLVYKMEHLVPGLVFLTLLDLYGSSKGRDNASTRRVRNRCREVLAAYGEWKKEPLPRIVTGHDLIALGLEEGPALGRLLEAIREKQIAGEITRKEEALEFAVGARSFSADNKQP